jgi:hypothetical protein
MRNTGIEQFADAVRSYGCIYRCRSASHARLRVFLNDLSGTPAR